MKLKSTFVIFRHCEIVFRNKTPADQRDIFRPKSFEQQNRFKSKNLYKYISHGTKFMSVTSSYTMVAKSDVQLKIKSYSVCEELFSFSTGSEINHF